EPTHHLHGDERPVGDPGKEAREEVHEALEGGRASSRSRARGSCPESVAYFFVAAAAARSFATSSQLFTTSRPWISSTSALTGLPCAFILTTPTHCGGIAC